MSCATGLRLDQSQVYYLEDHSDLLWVKANSSSMLNVPNAIILNGTSGLKWPFMFGRTIYKGQYTLGKAHVGNTFYLLNFWGDNGEERYLDNFEVLTCSPGNMMPRQPTKVNYNCGDYIKYNPQFANSNPINNGFSAGKFIDNSIIYAGVGNFSMCWGQNPAPGRFMTTNSISGPGVYCRQDNLD
jgi:hypothetical protein